MKSLQILPKLFSVALLITALFLMSVTTSFGQRTITSAASGTWSSTAWPTISMTGTIDVTTGDDFITGASTLFTSEIQIGDIIKTTGGTVIGTVSSIDADDLLWLQSAATADYSGTFTSVTVPGANDNVIIAAGHTVTLDGTSATAIYYCASLTIGTNATGTATLTFAGTNAQTLNVTNALTIGGATASDQTGVITYTRNVMKIVAGSLILGNYTNQASVINMTSGGYLKVIGAISSSSTASSFTPGLGTGIALSTLETLGTYTLPDIFKQVNDFLITSGTLTLSISIINQYGLLTVKAGATLNIGGFDVGSAGGTVGSNVVLENGALGSTITGSGMFWLYGGGAINGITVNKVGSGTNGATISCPVRLRDNRTITVASAGSSSDLTMSGVIDDLASVLLLTKEGAGSLTLTQHNTFSGGVTLNAGILNINDANALGDVSPVPNLGTFTITGGSIDNTSAADITTVNYPLALNGDFTYIGSVPHNLTFNGVPTFSASRNITVTAGKLTLGGIPANATAIDITKTGAGELSFAAQAVSIGGLTISAGTLTSTSGNLTINGTKNFINNSTFNHNNGKVTFSGSSTSSTISGSSTTTFYQLTNNPSKTLVGHATNMNVASTWTNNGTYTHNSGKVTFTGITTIPSTPVTSFYNVTVTGTLTSKANTNINVAGNWVNDGTFTHNGGTVTFNGSLAQAISGSATTAFNNLTNSNTTAAVSVNTNINVASSLTMGGAGSILTPAAAVVINSAGAAGTITGTGGILQVTRIASTADYSSQYKFTTNTLTNLTTEYTVLTGSQVVSGITYGSLKLDNTSGTNTVGGAVTVGGTFTTYNAGILDMGTNALSVNTVSHAGILKTQNTSSTPITTGKSWGGTVQYNATTGGQTVMAGTYYILRNENSSNTNTASGTITATELLYTTAGGTLNMVTNDLLGVNTVSNAGTIRTQHTATATPIPSGKTWGGTIQYDASTGAQTVMGGSYVALTLADNGTKTFSNTDPTTVSANFSVSGGAVTAPTLITFDGAAQTIDGLDFNNVTYSNSGTKTMNSNASVAGTLTVSGTAVLDADGTSNDKVYTLKSSASGTARIAANATNNYITGNITVERYLADVDGLGTPKRAWHLLSTKAVTSSQTIKQAWQEDAGAYVAGKGVWITSNVYSGSNGYDATSASASILPYKANGTWDYALSNTNTSILSSEQGYMLFAFGDRGDKIVNSSVHPTVIKATGIPTMGNVAVSVPASGIWTLLGNPYASPIDVEGILTASVNLNQQMYVWDATLAGNFGFGGYRVVDRSGGGTYTQTPFVAGGDANSRYIHSGQAFFVKATTSTVNFNITESMKASTLSVINPIMNGATDQQIYTNLMIINPDNSASLADGIRVRFDDSYTAAITDDIFKFSNTSESLASYRDGRRIMVERRPMINTNDTVFLRITTPAIKNYRLVIASLDFNQPGVTAFLQDNYLATITPITLNGSVNNFDFSVTAVAGSNSPDRFRIVFGVPSAPLPISFTGIKAYQQGVNVAVEWKVAAEQNVKNYEIEKSSNGVNFNKAATQLATANNGTDMSYNWLDVNPVSGNNFYRIRSTENSGLVKYSAIAKVNIGKLAPTITVYPNPITGKLVNLQFTAMDKGLYNIKLYNTIGQVVYTTQYSHTGGSATFGFSIGNVNAGAYLLELIGADNTKQTFRLQVAN